MKSHSSWRPSRKPTEAERRAFLEAACADNPCCEGLERLIAADLKTLGILEHQVQPAGSEQGSAGSFPVGLRDWRVRRHDRLRADTG